MTRERLQISTASRGAATGVAAVAVLLASFALAEPADGHPSGCAFPRSQPPPGDTGRVDAIPHGCVRLAVPADESRLPTVVVRQHDRRGRIVTRRFPLPGTNLDTASGSIGICGHDSSYLFVVSYPFVTVVAQELYDLGDRTDCATDVDRALLWTGQLSRLPSLGMTWYTHRAPG
jgi:hypothetical protein